MQPFKGVYILLPSIAAGFLIFFLLHQSIPVAAGIVVFAVILGLMIRWPETGIMVGLFSIYSNISVLAMRSETAIQMAAGPADKNPRTTIVLGALSLVLLVPLVFQLLIRKQRLIFDRGFIAMLALLTAYLASSWFALGEQLVKSQVLDYLLEGLVLYFLVTNTIRDEATLRRATWTLVFAGCFMASLSIVQRVTHTQNKIYGGLAQVASDFDLSTNRKNLLNLTRTASPVGGSGEALGELRAAGPIGETNRYGQILVVLLPLVVFLFGSERSWRLRVLSVIAGGIILGGVFLTLSRGALVAGVVVFSMMAYMRLLKPHQVLASALVVTLLITVLVPSVWSRMLSLERLEGLFKHTPAAAQAPDSSAVRRYVLNVAAWRVFLDHPMLGVGPGEFAEDYSTVYGNRIGLVEQRKSYRAHNLYLETLAETGAIGLVCLLSVLFVIMRGLWKIRSLLKPSRPDIANAAGAFFLSLSAYLISAIFAHLSYQRYFWILVALSSAALRVIRSHSPERSTDASNLNVSSRS
jgi:putative inorganic carbon (HCO3(-)) transporter